MKILHVIPSIAPRYGGPSMAIVQMCTALDHEGVETLIATTDADGPSRLAVPLGTKTVYKGVNVVAFPKQATEAFKYSQPLAAWLRGNVRRFDVVHIHAVFSHAPLAAAAEARRANVPYVVRPLGTLEPWSMAQKPVRKKLLWRLACRRMMQEAAAVHYTANEERRLAEKSLGLQRGVVVPLGITPELELGGPDILPKYGAKYVLCVCRLHPKKNLEMLIRAFAMFRKQDGRADWKLVIAGDGDREYRDRLDVLVKELQCGPAVVFPGWLDGAEKAHALRNARLFALISHQENLGISVIEALGCAVPVLISDRMNLAPEIREWGAGWVTPLEDAAVYRALNESLGAPDERKQRGDAGRGLVRARYTWNVVAKQLVELYEAVLKNGKPPVEGMKNARAGSI